MKVRIKLIQEDGFNSNYLPVYTDQLFLNQAINQ